MHEVNNFYCPVCGGTSDHKPVFVKNNFKMMRCKVCDMVHVEPMPTIEETIKYYQLDGIARYNSDYIKNRSLDTNIESRYIIYKDTLMKYMKKGDKILDIGCHDGAFLNVLGKAGFDIFGQEVNIELAEYVNKQLNITVNTSDLASLNIKEQYDCISALSVIEHVPNIEDVLSKINSLLRPGGYFLVEVPNVDSYQSLVIHYFFSQTLNFWFHPTPPIHLWEFNKKTIEKLLNKFGFSVVEMHTSEPFEGKDMAKYPEGYHIAREGLDIMNVENEKRRILKTISEQGDANIDEILINIGKTLIRKAFEECKVFSEVGDNKSGIWLIAQKK